MTQDSESKEICFILWLKGCSVEKIAKRATATTETVKGWVKDWERGKQQQWEVS